MIDELISNPLGAWLLKTTVEGTILIGVVLVLIAALGRNLGPRWRVALWTLVGLKLLIPASMSFLPGLGNWSDFGAPETAAAIEVPVEEPAVIEEIFPAASPMEIDPVLSLPVDEAETLSASVARESLSAAKDTNAPSLLTWLLGGWLGGALIFLLALVLRQHRFVRRIGNGFCEDKQLAALVSELSGELRLRKKINIVLGSEGSTPAVFGVFRPRLIVPEDWASRLDLAGLRYILMHELEHVRFRDVLWNWAAALVNALHWFNPLVWLAASRFRSDRELRCDADTLARLEDADRLAYGRTLLDVQENFHTAPTIAGLAPCVRHQPALRQRIAMITKPVASRRWLNFAFTLSLAGLVCLSFGSAQAVADDEEKAKGGSREGKTETLKFDGNGNPATDVAGGNDAAFFGNPIIAKRVVFVVDFSGSMSEGGRVGQVKRELDQCLAKLPPGQSFNTIYYSHRPWLGGEDVGSAPFRNPEDERDRLSWRKVDAGEIVKAREEVKHMQPAGATNWVPPIRLALAMNPPPDAIWLLSDGEASDRKQLLDDMGAINPNQVPIHTIGIELGGPGLESLIEVAEKTGGTSSIVVGGRVHHGGKARALKAEHVEQPAARKFTKLEKFLRDPKSPQGEFQVQFRRSHYFRNDVPDIGDLHAFRVQSPTAPFVDAFVFLKKSNPESKAILQRYGWSTGYRSVIELKWVKPDYGKPRIELQRIIRNSDDRMHFDRLLILDVVPGG